MSAMNLKQLRETSLEKLVEMHDDKSGKTLVGLDYFLNEINRRDQDRQTQEMMRLTHEMHRFTKHMRDMTIIILVATILAIVASVISLLK